jgi:ribosome-binding protein aMBF1 (putative translation factor)
MARGKSGPIGSTHRAGRRRRAAKSAAYRAEVERLAPFERVARMAIARRDALGLTQKEVAERMGTSHSVISRIESGQHPITLATLQRLATALDAHLEIGISAQEPVEAATSEPAGQQAVSRRELVSA